MMRPFEMETQAEVGAQQSAAALDLAPKQGGTQTKARAYWFDRDTILQEKNTTGWSGVPRIFSFPRWR